jgi:peptidoglycan hydrolase CwlO-like protein
MNNASNYPQATETQTPRKNSSKNAILGILAFALVAVSGYLIYDKSKSGNTIEKQQTQIAAVTDEKSELQRSFDGSLARLDSMASVNSSLQSKLTESNNEIAKTKTEIRSILNKKNASAAELSRAKNLIAKLNSNIADMEQQIAKLTQDNQTLTQEKTVLTEEKTVLTAEKQKLSEDLTVTTTAKEELAKKVDVASTLNASSISITPLKVKGNGKEKVTSTAKRVDKLMISFNVDNRIAEPGTTDIYVVVLGPDGKPVAAQTEMLTTREEGDKAFTAKVPVEIETAKQKHVEFAFAPGENFQQGSYTIQIYQNGFKIGEGTRELKKGGLFS